MKKFRKRLKILVKNITSILKDQAAIFVHDDESSYAYVPPCIRKDNDFLQKIHNTIDLFELENAYRKYKEEQKN